MFIAAVTIHANQYIFQGEKNVNSSFASNYRKQCLCYLLFYKIVVSTFCNFRGGFSLVSPKLHNFCA